MGFLAQKLVIRGPITRSWKASVETKFITMLPFRCFSLISTLVCWTSFSVRYERMTGPHAIRVYWHPRVTFLMELGTPGSFSFSFLALMRSRGVFHPLGMRAPPSPSSIPAQTLLMHKIACALNVPWVENVVPLCMAFLAYLHKSNFERHRASAGLCAPMGRYKLAMVPHVEEQSTGQGSHLAF